ncbi:MAG: polyprenyl synthetase family protein [Alphaproteobacteria bacterium]|nr:polyprenyl synthetase family protein [Alphaproteobacteria bacterium]
MHGEPAPAAHGPLAEILEALEPPVGTRPVLGPRAVAAPRGAADALELEMLRLLDDASPTVRAAAAYLVARGGKRVRARLVLAMAGDVEGALAAAARVEWLHQVSMVVDDVMDGAAWRRGSTSLHTLHGEPWAAAVALELLRHVLAGAPAGERARLALAGVELARGQLLETVEPPSDEPGYVAMVGAKTGALFGLALATGADLAGRDEVPAHGLGVEVGVAFQIVDDLLDLGAPDTGKPSLGDLANGRPTWPLQVLMERLEPHERDRLAGGPDVAWILERARTTGSFEHCRDVAHERLERARRGFEDDHGALPAAVHALLDGLVDRVS